MTDEADETPETSDTPEVTPPPAFPGDTLLSALTRHGIDLPAAQVERLDQYCKLLWDWNEKLNLTRHTDYEKFVSRDLKDTLELSRLVYAGEAVLDVGTGGGVPGVVLAIVRPDLQVALCDSVGKKVKAVQQMIEALGLECPVYPFRAEEVLEDMRFDALVVRAVGPLWKLLTWFRPHWNAMRRLLVIKGPKWPEELVEAKRRGLLRELQLKSAAEYPLPGTESNSVILKFWPKGTPER
ncbi:MAG: 16S rRNA (guanine(527)-N(7))-methyltransferase RsmG [Pirellulaceae bacterium]